MAEDMVLASDFDLVIVDDRMPASGLPFVRWLRREVARSTPVLLLAATRRDDMDDEGPAAAVTHTTTRPIDINRLCNVSRT